LRQPLEIKMLGNALWVKSLHYPVHLQQAHSFVYLEGNPLKARKGIALNGSVVRKIRYVTDAAKRL
jgi:hypothetical protein